MATFRQIGSAYLIGYLRSWEKGNGEVYKDRVRAWLQERGVTVAKDLQEADRSGFVEASKKGFM